MIEVSPRLYVGNQIDYEKRVKGKIGWSVVHCAKEPYHRQALGYKGSGCDRNDPEYLFAYRDMDGHKGNDRLCLNMVDAPKPEFFRDAMIDAALDFIERRMFHGNVLVHCNQGGSRGPSVALLYLHERDDAWKGIPFDEAESSFLDLYPSYQPGAGIREYLRQRWERENGAKSVG